MVVVLDKNDISYKEQVRNTIRFMNNPLIQSGTKVSDLVTDYLPINNAQTTYQKVTYRDEEHDKLKNINRIINIVYYCGIAVLLLLLFTANNLYPTERYPLYIFLILLPYLYPWIYRFAGILWGFIYPTINYTGPKNAFIDEPTYTNQPYDI
jgi:hypothetical protein